MTPMMVCLAFFFSRDDWGWGGEVYRADLDVGLLIKGTGRIHQGIGMRLLGPRM